MRKFGIFSSTIFISILLAGLYGILHDQITYSISYEYFTRFKFEQFRYDPSEIQNTRLTVGIIGFLATWWVGLFIGVVLGAEALIFPDHISMKKAVSRGVLIVFLSAVLAGVVGYIYGRYYLADNGVSWRLPDDLIHRKDFITVGAIHNCSYLGGAAGILIAVVYLIAKNISIRKKMARKINA